MTDVTDILGRPPIMRPLADPEICFDDDWSGEHFIRDVPLANQGKAGTEGRQTKRPARRAGGQG